MRLLAIDTATEACSCALHVDGEARESFVIAPRRHAELILSMISELLEQAGISVRQLDAFAFGRGPGAFTGVRIAAGIVQGLAFATDRPVAPVSCLQSLAQGIYRDTTSRCVLCAMDARMGEVYWGAFQLADDGLMANVVEECVAKPERVPLPRQGKWFGAGTGWAVHGETLGSRLNHLLVEDDPQRYPHAMDVARLGVAAIEKGRGVSAEEALPVYLRDQVANKPTRY